MKTLLTIISRWVIEVSSVFSIAMVIFLVRNDLGYNDYTTEWTPQLFLYLKLSLTTAIPWGLYYRARFNSKNGAEQEYWGSLCILFFGITLIISAINFFWATPEIRHVEVSRYAYEADRVTWEWHSFKDWAPYLASLAPLALWLLTQFIRICLFFDPTETAQPKVTQATQPIVASLNDAEMNEIGDRVEDALIKHLRPLRKDLKRIKHALCKVEKKIKGKQKNNNQS